MIMYDPRGMEWPQWCKLTAELFASQDLGTLPEEKWKDWADAFAGVGYFASSGVPDSKGFSSWQAWAARLVGIMAIDPGIAIGANNTNLPNSSAFHNRHTPAGITSRP